MQNQGQKSIGAQLRELEIGECTEFAAKRHGTILNTIYREGVKTAGQLKFSTRSAGEVIYVTRKS